MIIKEWWFPYEHCEDWSDWVMYSLIWVFAGHTGHLASFVMHKLRHLICQGKCAMLHRLARINKAGFFVMELNKLYQLSFLHWSRYKIVSWVQHEHTCKMLYVSKILLFSLQIVLYREKEILESECEMCVIHGLLSKIPDDLPFETLITRAYNLYQQYSPDELAHEAILNFKRQQRLVVQLSTEICYIILTEIRPNKKIPVFRVTWPCQNLLVKPRIFSSFLEK